ncbi:MAG: glucose 1-dehydrogenase [Firmicutes bacterium]|nr:glucose 1-dehydrogenase [Alicyclobacillaceae bacterium]MCL6497389.1 glucose 1-dehydrogenase [Bacillota bacterium]
MDLVGKVAWVTGAAQGIGRAVALALAEAGADVAVHDVQASAGLTAVAEAVRARGRRAVPVHGNVADAQAVAAARQAVVEGLGRLDILVNNAGIERYRPLLECTEEDWDAVVGVDLKGAFLCLQQAARWMRDHGGGVILNISSIHEDKPFPGYAPYCAAKGGLKMLMRDAALELAPHGIRVVNVAPGAIATPINRATLEDPAKLRRLEHLIPWGRLGTPEEVARVVVFLASEHASYVTGTTVVVDGGMMQYAEPL